MKEIRFNGHKLEVFDSIQHLPIARFHLYNLNAIIDSGIGSDLNAFNDRVNVVRDMVKRGNQEAALVELNNLQQSVYFVLENTSPRMNSFVALIHKIDDREITNDDLTAEGIAKIIEELNRKRLSMNSVVDFLKGLKKKIDREFETFFPGRFNTASIKEYFSNLKKRTLLVLEQITNPDVDNTAAIQIIDDFFYSKFKPTNFHGSTGLEVRAIRTFEETCLLLSQNGLSVTPKGLTTLAFFQALEVIREQAKKNRKLK